MFKRVTQRFTNKAKLDEDGTAAPIASGSKGKGKVVEKDAEGSGDEEEDEDFEDGESGNEDEDDDGDNDDEDDDDEEGLGPISGESDSSSDDDSDSGSDDEEEEEEGDSQQVKKNKNGKRPAPGEFDDDENEEEDEEEEDEDDDDEDPPPISLADCLTASPIYVAKTAQPNPDGKGGIYQTRSCIFCAKKVLKSSFAVEEHLGSRAHQRAKQRLENRLLSLEDLDTDDPRVLVAEIDAELERKKQVAAVEELVGKVDKDGNPLPSKAEKIKAKKEKNEKLKLKHQNQKAKRQATLQAKLASGEIQPRTKPNSKQLPQGSSSSSASTTISKLSKQVALVNPDLVANLKGNRKQRRKLLLEELELKKMVDKGLTEEEIKKREEGKKQREASKLAKKEKRARKLALKVEKKKARYFEQEA